MKNDEKRNLRQLKAAGKQMERMKEFKEFEEFKELAFTIRGRFRSARLAHTWIC